ncbi:hypothetical protein HZS_3488, partial [Henneguya salminicola]
PIVKLFLYNKIWLSSWHVGKIKCLRTPVKNVEGGCPILPLIRFINLENIETKNVLINRSNSNIHFRDCPLFKIPLLNIYHSMVPFIFFKVVFELLLYNLNKNRYNYIHETFFQVTIVSLMIVINSSCNFIANF